MYQARRGGERPQRLLVVERSRERQGDFGEKRRRAARPWPRGASACFRSEISRAIFEAPTTLPSASRIGETVSEMGIEAPVAALAHRFEVIDTPTGADRFEHGVFLGLSIVGNDATNRSADHLVGCVAEHPLGGIVPRQNDAVQIFADNRIVGRLDNRSQPARNVVERIRHAPQTS